MKNLFKIKKINEIGFVGRGRSKHRPRNDPKLYGGRYPFIQTSDVKNTNLYITDYSQTYNETGLSQSKLWQKGTLCITIAANIAETGILGMDACFPDSIVGFITDENQTCTKYVKYYLDTIKLNMQQISKGTTQDNLSLEKLLSFNIKLPSLMKQKKIASILSAFDDLIEINNRRIKIIEEMAQLIYKEWFVNFRFPGYEKVKIVDSELGKIPEGWEVKPLRSLIDYYIGGGWGKDEKIGKYTEKVNIIRGTDIPNVKNGNISNCPSRYIKNSQLLSRNLKKYNIIFEVSGGSKDQLLGRHILITNELIDQFENPLICASFCKLVRPNLQLISPFIISLFIQELYDTKNIAKYQVQSTGISNFKFETFLDEEKIFIPEIKIWKNFHQIMIPLFSESYKLGFINSKLRKIGDLLLPKLISGEIDTDEIDL